MCALYRSHQTVTLCWPKDKKGANTGQSSTDKKLDKKKLFKSMDKTKLCSWKKKLLTAIQLLTHKQKSMNKTYAAALLFYQLRKARKVIKGVFHPQAVLTPEILRETILFVIFPPKFHSSRNLLRIFHSPPLLWTHF